MTGPFLWHCLVVGLGMAVVDAFWTVFVTKANEGRALAAGTASVVIVLLNSTIVIEYVHDRRLVGAAAVGAFLGTVTPILWKRRRA